MKKLFIEFDEMEFEKIIKFLYPSIVIMVYMKFYYRLSINPSSLLYGKKMLQQIVFTLDSIYFRIIEPIIIVLIIKLLLEIILLFYKNIEEINSRVKNTNNELKQ